MPRAPLPPLPAAWTVIARRTPGRSAWCADLWTFSDGWDQVAVNTLRDTGTLCTVQRRERDGSLVLLARQASARAPQCTAPLRRGVADAIRRAGEQAGIPRDVLDAVLEPRS